MSRALTLVFGLSLAGAVVMGACAKQSSEASDASDASGASEKPSAAGTQPGTQVAYADAQAAKANKSDAAAAYEALVSKIRGLERSATTPEARIKAFGEMTTLLKTFISNHPSSEEAQDARFQLGILYFSLMDMENAQTYFEQLIESSTEDADDKRMGYAHFYLAESYKESDKFEEAKKHYNIVISRYTHVDPRILSGATAGLDDLETRKRLAIGSEPIPFEVTDIKGKKLSLEKYKGKVVLLDFWATWCAPCVAEMPNVIRIHRKYNKQGFEIVGISLDRDRNALENYVRSQGMSWQQHFDGNGWSNKVATEYRIRSIPMTYLIDRKGKIRYRSLRGHELEEAVERLVKENV